MRLNKRLWRESKVVEMILDKGEYQENEKKERIFIDGAILRNMACQKCPIHIECIIGKVSKTNPILDPHLLPNIISAPRIYCFSRLRHITEIL